MRPNRTETSGVGAGAHREAVAPELFGPETDPESQKPDPSLVRVQGLSLERMGRVVKEFAPTHVIMTVSGGDDSLAAAEFAREAGVKVDAYLHCRTRTGIRQTTEHVIDYYGGLGPDLIVADAGSAYERYVMRKGFFGVGPGAHAFSYHILKADPMRAAISKNIRKRQRGVRVMLLNGARASESPNRRINLKETRLDKGNLWVNIIHDWTNGNRDGFIRRRGCQRNPVSVQLCRSGECFCGTQQTKAERAEAAVLYPEFGAYLDDLDRCAKAKFGWGWGEPMPRPADPNQLDMFQPLCGGCGRQEAA